MLLRLVWFLNKGLAEIEQKIPNINVFSAKDFYKNEDIEKYDLIVYDESQRIFKKDLDKAIKIATELKKHVIFSFGFNQNLNVDNHDSDVLKRITNQKYLFDKKR